MDNPTVIEQRDRSQVLEKEPSIKDVLIEVQNRKLYNAHVSAGEKLKPGETIPLLPDDVITITYISRNRDVKVGIDSLPVGAEMLLPDLPMDEDNSIVMGFFKIGIEKLCPEEEFTIPVVVTKNGEKTTQRYTFIIREETLDDFLDSKAVRSELQEVSHQVLTRRAEVVSFSEVADQLQTVRKILQSETPHILYGFSFVPGTSRAERRQELDGTEHIHKLHQSLKAFETLFPELRIRSAQESDNRIANNSPSRKPENPSFTTIPMFPELMDSDQGNNNNLPKEVESASSPATIYKDAIARDLETLATIAEHWSISLEAGAKNSVRADVKPLFPEMPSLSYEPELVSYLAVLDATLNSFQKNAKKYVDLLLEAQTFDPQTILVSARNFFSDVLNWWTDTKRWGNEELSVDQGRLILELCQTLKDLIEAGSELWPNDPGKIEVKEVVSDYRKLVGGEFAQTARETFNFLDEMNNFFTSNHEVTVTDLQKLYDLLAGLQEISQVATLNAVHKKLAESIENFFHDTQEGMLIGAIRLFQQNIHEMDSIRNELAVFSELTESSQDFQGLVFRKVNQLTERRARKNISNPETYINTELRTLLNEMLSPDLNTHTPFAVQMAILNERLLFIHGQLNKVIENLETERKNANRVLSIKETSREPLCRRNPSTGGLWLKCIISGVRPHHILDISYDLQFEGRDPITVREEGLRIPEIGGYASEIKNVNTDEKDEQGKKIFLPDPDHILVIAKTYKNEEDRVKGKYDQIVTWEISRGTVLTREIPMVQLEPVSVK